jgi:hypothetical protein
MVEEEDSGVIGIFIAVVLAEYIHVFNPTLSYYNINNKKRAQQMLCGE